MARKGRWLRSYVREQLKDPDFRRNFEATALPAKLAFSIVGLRRDYNITQAELARRMGVSQQMIAQLESISGSSPTIRTLERVAQAFGKSLLVEFR